MKKILALFLVMFMFLSISTISYANDLGVNQSDGYIEYYNDGSYSVTTLETSSVTVLANSTVSKSKTTAYYNSDSEKQWEITVKGTFTYTGSSATCTNSAVSYKIYNTKWKVTSAQASKSGAKAIGDFTVKYYVIGIPTKTVNKTLTLTCSNTGVCS